MTGSLHAWFSDWSEIHKKPPLPNPVSRLLLCLVLGTPFPLDCGPTHLEPLDVFHLGGLPGGDAGVEEGGRDGDAEGLGRHAGLGGLAVGVDDAEGAEEEDQQVLRVHRQRGEHPAREQENGLVICSKKAIKAVGILAVKWKFWLRCQIRVQMDSLWGVGEYLQYLLFGSP